MGRKGGEALIGGVIGYGLWWLARLALPFVDLDGFLWVFLVGGAIGAVVLSELAEKGPRETFLPLLVWGLAMAGLVALSWGGGRILEVFPSIPAWIPIVLGFAVVVVAVNVWDAKQRKGRPPELLPSQEEGPEPDPEPDPNDIPESDMRSGRAED